MKQKFVLLASAWLLVNSGLQAQTTDNFNSRPGVSLSQVKVHLQGNCWSFPGFEINRNNWNPGIEGNGAMVSSTPSQNTGIYSPVLDVPANVSVSFSYKFNQALEQGTNRFIKVFLTDANNTIVSTLDSISFNRIVNSTFYTYKKSFKVKPGQYKVYINYEGTGNNLSLAIDELVISAPAHYSGGCNLAPVAKNDNVTGFAHHHASGQVTVNDVDPNNDKLTAYLVKNSPDGTVVMNPDGNFTFTPNTSFTGNSTTFTYKVCDNGYGTLCSGDGTVTINFPSVPINLVNFKGLYRSSGNVEITWATNYEQNSDRFEVERSFDGYKWKLAGSKKAVGVSASKSEYEFVDDVGTNTANKRDLYYRLKQIDQQGKVTTSKLMVVRVYNTANVKMISVTPSPEKNDIGVNVQLNSSAFVAMKILNKNNDVVINKTLKADIGDNSFALDGSKDLRPGEYTLEVAVNSKERMLIKLLKE